LRKSTNTFSWEVIMNTPSVEQRLQVLESEMETLRGHVQDHKNTMERMGLLVRTIAFAVNTPVTHRNPKLELLRPFEPRDPQTWLNTAYCFDLALQMEYVARAVLDFEKYKDPEELKTRYEMLMRLAERDYHRKSPREGIDWEKIAPEIEELLRSRYGALQADGYEDEREHFRVNVLGGDPKPPDAPPPPPEGESI
jgi:hypothetical protein